MDIQDSFFSSNRERRVTSASGWFMLPVTLLVLLGGVLLFVLGIWARPPVFIVPGVLTSMKVEEARLTHLAYAPEIAQAMLRRQQAEAIIAARQKIVQGAVGMVEMALTELMEKQVVELDAERKAAMVSNLLVVLCGESEVHPVVNAGTLYS